MTNENNNTQIDKKFIKNIQGNEFVLHEGLLDAFHQNGGTNIQTEILSANPDGETIVFKATVSGAWGEFTGHGDANDSNVGPMIKQHKLRMAETRAINRALRFYNNVGMCSAEELGGNESTKSIKSTEIKPKADKLETEVPGNNCYDCGIEVKDNVKKFSIDKYDRILCFVCQQKEKNKNATTNN